MTTTEGHDMPPELTPLTNAKITAINARWSRFCVNPSHDNALTSAHDVPGLLAEVDRLRAENIRCSQIIAEITADNQGLQDALKTAKSARFENNGVGDVAAHIQAETINDLRLN
jgi:hypothetical protein